MTLYSFPSLSAVFVVTSIRSPSATSLTKSILASAYSSNLPMYACSSKLMKSGVNSSRRSLYRRALAPSERRAISWKSKICRIEREGGASSLVPMLGISQFAIDEHVLHSRDVGFEILQCFGFRVSKSTKENPDQKDCQSV